MTALPAAGSAAPEFSLPDLHGTPLALSALRGKPVLVMFFPGAFSGVCTAEVQELRSNAEAIAATGTQLVAISCDPPHAQRAWAEQEGLDLPVLSDFWPHGATAAAYGAFNEVTGRAQRASVLVDADGVVRWTVLNAPGEARSLEDYRAAIAAL